MSEVNERTQRTSLLRGPVTDIPGLTSYIATNFVSLTGGGNVTGEVFIASGGALYLYDPVADTDRELTVVDGDLFVGGVAVGGGGGGGDALTTNPLSQFAATTSAQLAGVISDETGSGALVFATSPTLTTPTLGVASCTSLAVGANVTIVRNATGPTLETRAAGGLKVCNADGSAVAGVQCSTVSVLVSTGLSGVVIGNSLSTQAGIGFYGSGTRMALYADNAVAMFLGNGANICANGRPLVFSQDASGLGNTRISEASAGILQIGTTSNNALGSLNLASLTASGVAKFSGYPTGLLPAAASNAGSITYDTTLAKHVGCNGSSWNALW